MFHTGQELPLRRAITPELIRDDHPGHVHEALEQLAKKFLRCGLVPPVLHQNIQHMAVLIHGPPEIMAPPLNGQKDFVQMPFIARLGASTPELVSVGLPKLRHQ
jgi:hypothetical protein